MKNMVQILVQPKWRGEWWQNFALRRAHKDFIAFRDRLNNNRWAEGNGYLNYTKLLSYPEIRDWLSDYYIDLRGKAQIRMDYAEFERRTLDHTAHDYIWRSTWNMARCPYRQGSGYTQDPAHLPKEREANAWHAETHHKRDKARHGHGCMRHGCRGRRFWVKQAARDLRAWVKQQLHKGNFDAFDRGAQDKEYQQFADPWNWD